MSEIVDLVMPVLQKIQADIAEMKRGFDTQFAGIEAKLNDVAERQLEEGETLDDMKRYMTFHMGITMQHQSDITDLKAKMPAETQP